MNGAVTLGNGTPDDISILGSLAATIPIKTNNSFDFGSSTLGLAGVYLGAPSSRTTRVTSNQAIGASYTLVLPPSAGSAGQALVSTGSGTLFQTRSSLAAENYGLAASVASNALTISLTDAAGSTPSAASPVDIAFRSATAATGTVTNRTVSSATTVVVPSTATLGHRDSVENAIWIYAIDNAGTVELAVSSILYDTGSRVSTTGIGIGSDSISGLYSTTSRTNVAIRLLGRAKSTQTTAGTWAAVPTELSPMLVGQETIAAQVALAADVSATANAAFVFDTVLKDTHGCYSTTTGLFTCPKSGYYRLSVSAISTVNAANLLLAVDGNQKLYLTLWNAAGTQSGSASYYVAAGSTLSVESDGTITADGVAEPYACSMHIEYLGA